VGHDIAAEDMGAVRQKIAADDRGRQIKAAVTLGGYNRSKLHVNRK
jgi:hypothetical protein